MTMGPNKMQFPWVPFFLIIIPMIAGIWYYHERKYRPILNRQDEEIRLLDQSIEYLKDESAN